MLRASCSVRDRQVWGGQALHSTGVLERHGISPFLAEVLNNRLAVPLLLGVYA